MRKNRKIRLIVTVLCIVVIGILIIDGFLELREANRDDSTVAYELTKDDSSIISNKYMAGIKVRMVFKSSVREPVSFVDYDKKYQIVIHKINVDSTFSFPNAFEFKEQSLDRTIRTVYTVVPYGAFDFQWKAGLVERTSKIILTMSGDSIQNINSNDSIISYHLRCDNLAIRYSEDSDVDISVSANYKIFRIGNNPKINVLFLRRDNSVYLLTMITTDSKAPLPPDLLYNLVTGN